MLGFVAERPGHPATPGVDKLHLQPGGFEASDARRDAAERFLVAVPVQENAPAGPPREGLEGFGLG